MPSLTINTKRNSTGHRNKSALKYINIHTTFSDTEINNVITFHLLIVKQTNKKNQKQTIRTAKIGQVLCYFFIGTY